MSGTRWHDGVKTYKKFTLLSDSFYSEVPSDSLSTANELNMADIVRQINQILTDIDDKNIKFDKVIQHTRGTVVARLLSGLIPFILKYIDLENADVFEDVDKQSRIKALTNEIKVLKDIRKEFDLYRTDGCTRNYLWFTMNYVEGENSYKTLYNLSPPESKSITKSILKRINTLHKLGYLHRDIQPAHIIVGKNRTIQLLDFGLAKKFDSNDIESFRGGLVHYIPPELARGLLLGKTNNSYDLLSEIYAIGSSLFFSYTGKTSTNYGSSDFKSVPYKHKLRMIARSETSQEFESTEISDSEKELIKWMLKSSKKDRCPSLDEAIRILD